MTKQHNARSTHWPALVVIAITIMILGMAGILVPQATSTHNKSYINQAQALCDVKYPASQAVVNKLNPFAYGLDDISCERFNGEMAPIPTGEELQQLAQQACNTEYPNSTYRVMNYDDTGNGHVCQTGENNFQPLPSPRKKAEMIAKAMCVRLEYGSTQGRVLVPNIKYIESNDHVGYICLLDDGRKVPVPHTETP